MRKTKLDWSALVNDATRLVLEHQQVSYPFLKEKLNLGVGTANILMKRLTAGGIIAQGKDRHWVVLVAADGVTRREPPAPYVGKRRVKQAAKAQAATAAPTSPAEPSPKPVKAKKKKAKSPQKAAPATNGAATFSDADKRKLLETLRDAAPQGGKGRAILSAIITDFATIGSARKITDAVR